MCVLVIGLHVDGQTSISRSPDRTVSLLLRGTSLNIFVGPSHLLPPTTVSSLRPALVAGHTALTAQWRNMTTWTIFTSR